MTSLEEQLADLERMIGVTLPEDYRAFVLADAGRTILGQEYYMPHPDGRWIEDVHSVNSLRYLLGRMPVEIDLRRQGISDFPVGTLPIADDGCGDTVLLSYSDQDFGSVYHVFLEEGDADDPWAGVYRLAPSFSEWLNQLGTFSSDA
ncbi:MAG: hypothetical protein QOE70_4261 [Chthoniobacter sp.]|jgi:hypothetical protein|nr:hypothetical protein [Chthoniobacter sp.]